MVRDIGSTEGWVEFKLEVSKELENWGKEGDVLRIDFGSAPDLKLQIRNIKFRQLTSREKEIIAQKEQKKKEEKILENNLIKYLNTEFDSAITNVLVKEEEIVISFKKSEDKEIYLAEIPIYENVTELESFQFLEPLKDKAGNFQISVDRKIERNGYIEDRVLSKWALASKISGTYSLISQARYADSIVPKYTYSFVKH